MKTKLVMILLAGCAGLAAAGRGDALKLGAAAPVTTVKMKNVDGREVYFFANSSETPVDCHVRLRGRPALEEWDPHTGGIRPANQAGARLHLDPRHGVRFERPALSIESVGHQAVEPEVGNEGVAVCRVERDGVGVRALLPGRVDA